MFTWICPTCGRELQPSQDTCPNCAAAAKAAPQAPQTPFPPHRMPPPPMYPPPPPRAKSGLPGWVVSLLVAGGLLGIGYGAFSYLGSRGAAAGSAAAEPSSMAPPAPSGAASKNPYSKHLEVAGLRITEDANKRLKVKYVVVNHSRADLPDLELIVALRSPGKEGTAPVCIFKAKVPGLGPFESKDLSANVPTNLRVYELPDWQFLRADFEVISPK